MQFNKETNEEVKKIITQLCSEFPRRRIRIWYGDTKTGRAWNDEHDIMGYIGRSTGNTESDKIPLLVANKRSLGGGGLLDHCIIRIDDIKAKKTLYKHEKFHITLYADTFEVRDLNKNDTLYASFKTSDKARKFIEFMKGERYAK
jgi:hypothetical protein